MSEEEKIRLLQERWIGQEERIERIIADAKKKPRVDWTRHLDGLPFVEEIEPDFLGDGSMKKTKNGKDLRGINLSGKDLKGIFLRGAHLEYAVLREANLEYADLCLAHLENADLSRAHLEHAVLSGANLKKANLSEVHLEAALLEYVVLRFANLYNADLSRAYLENADFRRAHLENTVLFGANLEKAVLRGANLEKAVLIGANLEYAVLIGAHLEKADLRGANLENADLSEVHLEKAVLRGANLENADLSVANLENVVLRFANLENADLFGANLENADLREAHLEDTVLSLVNLENADLRFANLEYADLFGANLEYAVLSGALLENADLRDAKLRNSLLGDADLTGVRVNEHTDFGFNREPFWKRFRAENRMLRDEYEAQELERQKKFKKVSEKFENAQSVYRQLNEAYKQEGMRYEAGKFYYREMVCRRKAKYPLFPEDVESLRELPKSLSRLIKTPSEFFSWIACLVARGAEALFFDILCGYGERPLRVVFWILLVVLVSAVIYWQFGEGIVRVEESTGTVCHLQTPGEALYFSITTFTTLGFGDFHPAHDTPLGRELKYWIAGEAAMGAFLLALALVTFARLAIRD